MALEPFDYITSLDASNPAASDNISQGDDHIRGVKTTLLNSFPNVDDACDPTPVEFNRLVGVTEDIQPALDNGNAALNAVQALDPKQQPTYVQSAGDALHDLDITSGFILIGKTPVLTNTMTKQSDAVWAAGTNQGGRAAGNSTYVGDETVYLHVLSSDDGLISDYGYDTNRDGSDLLADANVVAAGLTLARPIGVFRLAAGNFRAFTLVREFGHDFIQWTVGIAAYNGEAYPNRNVDMQVPESLWVETFYNINITQLGAVTGSVQYGSYSLYGAFSAGSNAVSGLESQSSSALDKGAQGWMPMQNSLFRVVTTFANVTQSPQISVYCYGYRFNRHEL